jgi:hypothetical protein
VGVFQLERTTFIYWPIESTLKVLFIEVCQFETTTFMYWAIDYNIAKAWFVMVLQLEELHLSIGQLNALQNFIYKIFFKLKTSWKKYIHLGANWMHSKCFICQGVPTWNNYIHILTNWVKFHWLGCSKLKKLLSCIRHWMHLKILICVNVSTCKNYLHVHWPIKCIPKVLIMGMYELVGITYIYRPI